MLIDLHMHERTHSPDSFLRLEDMVSTARRLGLDAICITDHDSMGLKERAEGYAARTGYPIFVGVEYYSLDGDIVAFGVDRVPEKRILAQEFIDYVHRENGVCFAAHPYRGNNRGLGHKLTEVRGLDGIEAFNASTDFGANLRALAACDKAGVQPVGVSDCHVLEKIGVYATCLPGMPKTLPDLINAFKRGLCYPVGLLGHEYVDLRAVAGMLDPRTAVLPSGMAEGSKRDKTA